MIIHFWYSIIHLYILHLSVKKINRLLEKDEIRNLGIDKNYKKSYLIMGNFLAISLLICNNCVYAT